MSRFTGPWTGVLVAVVDDGVPQAVRFGLVVGGDLEREGLAVLELGAAVESDAGDGPTFTLAVTKSQNRRLTFVSHWIQSADVHGSSNTRIPGLA